MTLDAPLVGNALLSNTSACEASRLVAQLDDGRSWLDARRALDLMSLIDAVVLHDKLLFLPASMPDDLDELELRNTCLAAGALAMLEERDDHHLVGKALLEALATAAGHTMLGGEVGIVFPEVRKYFEGELGLGRTPRRSRVDRLILSVDVERASSFDEAARTVISLIEYGGSGAYESGSESLREMYYVFASEHHGLPYLPPASGERVAHEFPNYFAVGVRGKLYDRLASALRTTVEMVVREFHSEPLFIPPFSALVLDRAASPASISTEALALRDEFSDFRANMRELELERFDATTLAAKVKAIRRADLLCKEVARPFESQSELRLESTLRYIPDVVDVATHPTSPVSWTKLLLEKPADFLVDWFRRRPVRKLVHTARSVGAIAKYDELLTKHFGSEVSAATREYQSAGGGDSG